MPIGNRKLRSSYPRFWKHEKHENVFVSGRQKSKLPPLQVLKWLFRYDSETGKLFRIRESSGKLCEPEREITYVSDGGYLCVRITDSEGLQKWFRVHQIIYYMVSRVEPLSIVDHINGDKLDNRFSNFRLATQSGNSRNAKMRSHNTSGITGVVWNKRSSKWVARASGNTGKRKFLGCFLDKDEAIEVVSAWYANPVNGYTDRHGLNASISTCTDV